MPTPKAAHFGPFPVEILVSQHLSVPINGAKKGRF